MLLYEIKNKIGERARTQDKEVGHSSCNREKDIKGKRSGA